MSFKMRMLNGRPCETRRLPATTQRIRGSTRMRYINLLLLTYLLTYLFTDLGAESEPGDGGEHSEVAN